MGPVNLLAGSLFSQVDVALQGKSVTSTTNHYPYKCMFETLLSYGSETKTSQLTSQLFIKDTPGALDDNDVKMVKIMDCMFDLLIFKSQRQSICKDLFFRRV